MSSIPASPVRRLALVAALPLLWAATVVFADRVDTFVALGKSAPVTVAGAGDTATVGFLIQDGPAKKLSVTVKLAKKSGLVPDVRLVAPDGTAYDAAGVTGLGGKVKTAKTLVSFSLPNVPTGQGGLWRAEVRGAGDSSGAATVTVKAKDVTTLSETATVPATNMATREISVGSNQALTVTLSRAAKGINLVPQLVILDPSGNPLDGGAFLGKTSAKSGKVLLKNYRLPVFGTYRLVLTGQNGGGGPVKIVAKTAPAKAGKGLPVAVVDETDAERSAVGALDGTDSHGSGGSLAYAWSQVAGAPVTLDGSATSAPTFTAPAADASLAFELAVQDHGTWSLPVPVTVEVGRRPVADAGRSQAVATAAEVTLDGTGSLDRRGEGLGFRWTQDAADATKVTLTGADTAHPTFTAPASPAVLHFSLVVDDGRLRSFDDVVAVRAGDAGQDTPDAGREQYVPRMATVHLSALGTIRGSGVLDGGLAWTQVEGPPVTLSDASSPFPSFQSPKQAADLVFRLTAGSATDDVRVHVRTGETNLPPLTVGGGAQVLTSGDAPLSATGSLGPESGSTLSFRWAQVAGPALAPAADDAITTTVSVPAGNASRTYAVQAYDTLAYGPPDVVQVRNGGYTGGPVAVGGADRTVQPAVAVQLDGRGSFRTTGTDPLTYRWRQVSAKDWFDVETSIPSFDPTAPFAQFTLPTNQSSLTTRRTMTFELTVNDGTSASEPDLVTVTFLNLPQNGKPLTTAGASTTSPIPGETVTLQGGTLPDPDGDPVTARWSQTFGPTITLVGGPFVPNPTFTAPSSGRFDFQYTANDGFENGPPSTVSIVVDAAPTASLVLTPSSGASGQTVTVNGTASSDPEGKALAYLWTQTAGPAVAAMPADTATASWSFVAPAQTVAFRLVVSDGRQSSAPATGSYTVGVPVVVAPSASASSAPYGGTVTLNANATGTPTIYAWTQLTSGANASDPNVGTITNSGSATASFKVPKPTGSTGFGGSSSNLPGATFQITAQNTSGGSDTKTVRVTFYASFNDAGGFSLGASDTVYGLIQQSCFGGGCHGGTANVTSCNGQAFGMGSASAARNNLVNVNAACSSKKRVDTTNGSASSYVIDRLKGTASPQMPQGGSWSAARTALIADWIDQGGQNN